MAKMMGIDVGRARVGIALSDPEGILAAPCQTLSRDEEHLSDIEAIVNMVVHEKITEVYVGLPTTLSGRQGQASADAQRYARQLARLLRCHPSGATNSDGEDSVRIRLLDERMTTVVAYRVLHANGKKLKGCRKVVDQIAAQEILQHAIESKRHQGDSVGIVVRVET